MSFKIQPNFNRDPSWQDTPVQVASHGTSLKNVNFPEVGKWPGTAADAMGLCKHTNIAYTCRPSRKTHRTCNVKLFLHIGYPKTGTSAIQAFLVKNKEQLKKQGCLYPQTGRLGHAHYGVSSAFGLGRHSAADASITPAKIQALLDSELKQSDCTSLILSSENFILSKNPKVIGDTFSDFDIHPIVYLRRHDDWFESAYNQSVRMVQNPPWGTTIEGFVQLQINRKALPFDYYELLKLWDASFPGGRLIVRPFEKEQNKPDIFADFLNAIDLSMNPGFETHLGNAGNESISSERLMIIDAIQRTNASSELKRKIVKGIIEKNEVTSDRYTFLSPTARADLLKRYSPSYEKVAKEFLTPPNERLFVSPEPNPTDEWVPPSEPEWRRSVDIIIDVLSDQSQSR